MTPRAICGSGETRYERWGYNGLVDQRAVHETPRADDAAGAGVAALS